MKETELIHNVIGLNEIEYNNLVFEFYFEVLTEYCEYQKDSTTLLQLLIQNNSVFNWFKTELEQINISFLKDIEPYRNQVNKSDLFKSYKVHVRRSNLIYPLELIRRIRKNSKATKTLKLN